MDKISKKPCLSSLKKTLNKRDSTMKFLKILLALLVIVCFGCSPLIPKHPTKSKQAYHADKADCEKKGREQASSQQGMYFTPKDEILFTRDCLKKKGWKYLP